MIKVLDEKTEKFVAFLNEKYPLKGEVKLFAMWGYDAVMSDESGNSGFAVYLPTEKTIMLPLEIPEDILEINNTELNETFVIHNLAHEYCHAMQDERGEDFDEKSEDEANDFADKVVKEFMEI